MLAKRIIPCLDVRDGKVVKGINFLDIKEVGDPVECAMAYDDQGADEIVFLDITATHEGRGTMIEVVRSTAKNVFVPLTVGGGIRSVEDFRALLRAGADKISVNSAAIRNHSLISEAAFMFGSQCVVVAIDAGLAVRGDEKSALPGDLGHGSVFANDYEAREKTAQRGDPGHLEEEPRWNIFVNGGRIDTGINLIEWVMKAEELGAGEILLTSMDTDGTKAGFDLAMLNAVCSKVHIPVIASGGGGGIVDFTEVFNKTDADAALAASIFHYGELSVGDVKRELSSAGVPVRL
jgi:cyclase